MSALKALLTALPESRRVLGVAESVDWDRDSGVSAVLAPRTCTSSKFVSLISKVTVYRVVLLYYRVGGGGADATDFARVVSKAHLVCCETSGHREVELHVRSIGESCTTDMGREAQLTLLELM
jgi:hypothetical protein